MLFIHILIYFGIRGRIRTAYGECLSLLFKSVIHLIDDCIKDGSFVPIVLIQRRRFYSDSFGYIADINVGVSFF